MRWDLIRQAHFVLVSSRSEEFKSLGDGAIFEVLDFDCYAELIQSSEHLCSPLIFKSMQHCKRITVPESQYPLMRHFYSCNSRLKSLFVPSL